MDKTHLLQRGNSWSFNLIIPRALRHHFGGRSHIRRALGTSDLREANVRKLKLLAESKSLFRKLESATPQMAAALVAREYAEELRSKGIDPIQAVDAHDYTFADAIQDGLEEQVAAGALTVDQARRLLRISTGESKLIKDVAEEWLSEVRLKPATVVDYRRAVDRLTEFLGGDGALLSDVTHAKAAEYVSSVKQLKLGRKSKQARIFPLGGLWNWMAERLYVPRELSNPWEGFKFDNLATNTEPKERKRGYSEAELLKVLGTKPVYRALDEIIVLGMWSGARIEELCSLRMRDVRDRGDVVLVEIAAGKTAAAVRTIVFVHALPCAVIRSRVGRQADPDGHLFTEFTPGGHGKKLSWHVSKAYGRHRNSVGLTHATDFHSFRRTVATLLDNADLTDSQIARMLGHETGSLARDLYSDGPKVERLIDHARRIVYPDAVVAAAERMIGLNSRC